MACCLRFRLGLNGCLFQSRHPCFYLCPMPANTATRFDFNRDPFSGLNAKTMPQLFDEARYQFPPASPDVPEHLALYEHAKACAASMELAPGCRHYRVVSGNFIFGDFLEALLVEKHIQAKELTISTYSFSRANVDSLRGLLQTGHVQKLTLIMSAGQFGLEMHDTVAYALEQMDFGNERFQLVAAGTHCKLACIETARGNKLTIHGSANLRSSGNLEQFVLEEGAEFYDFNMAFQRRIIERFAIINHGKPLKKQQPLRRAALWAAVNAEVASY